MLDLGVEFQEAVQNVEVRRGVAREGHGAEPTADWDGDLRFHDAKLSIIPEPSALMLAALALLVLLGRRRRR